MIKKHLPDWQVFLEDYRNSLLLRLLILAPLSDQELKLGAKIKYQSDMRELIKFFLLKISITKGGVDHH